MFFTSLFLLTALPGIAADLSGITKWHYPLAFAVFFISYLLTVLLHLLRGRAQRIYKGTVYTAVYVLTASEMFLLTTYQTLVTPQIVQFVQQTDPDESLAFFRDAFLTRRFALFAACCGTVIVLNILISRWWARRRDRNTRSAADGLRHRQGWTDFVLLGLLLYSCALFVETNYRIRRIFAIDSPEQLLFYHSNIPHFSLRGTTLGRLHYSVSALGAARHDAERLREAHRNIAIDSCSFRSPRIVLIIGESFNKYHSSLYGYDKPTNPQLGQRRDKGELAVFTDVVAPANATLEAVKGIFSFNASDRPERYWASKPLVQAVFKKAGYATYHLDNQVVPSARNSVWNFSLTSFLYVPGITEQLFTGHNDSQHPFDMDLLEDRRAMGPLQPRELTTYHLMGQHFNYSRQCPPEEAFFTPDSYPADKPLYQLEIIADYDNATRYNDRVVDSIFAAYADEEVIGIYLSDHGEEVYDYRNFHSRSHQPGITPQIARYQFEIPFMIWMSDKYRERHPDIAAQVFAAQDRPYISDDMPHLLLDLAGIAVSYYEPQRSLINDRFDPGRPRMLRGEVDYDRLMGRK